MIDPRTLEIVHAAIRRETLSFAHYVRDSLPWPSLDGEEVRAALNPLFESEYKAFGDVCRLLTRHRLPLPHVGSYPSAYTTRNFISLQGLLPFLIDEERTLIANLEADLRGIHDPEAQRVVDHLREVKHSNLNRFQEISMSSPMITTAS